MQHRGQAAHTLFLGSLSLPSARQLAAVAAQRRWNTVVLDESSARFTPGARTFYGGTDKATQYVRKLQLALIEPPLDLLTRLPWEFLQRDVFYLPLAALSGKRGPLFIKPADPINKCFDVGVYCDLEQIYRQGEIPADTPVLAAEPVEWTAEYRCFIRDRHIVTWSPYLSFGKPIWKPGMNLPIPPNLIAFCDRLFKTSVRLPPAFVVDIGVLEDGRWAVVEFNPAWCSGILGAEVAGVLQTIERAARWERQTSLEDKEWVRL